jgi:hypothetical protein
MSTPEFDAAGGAPDGAVAGGVVVSKRPMSVATDQEAAEFLRQAQEWVSKRCVCTDAWPCEWHGSMGRAAGIPSEAAHEALKPYRTEAEWNAGEYAYVPYTPPVEQRPKSNGHRATASTSAADRPPLPDAVGVAFDAVDALRRKHGSGVRYRVHVTWRGCGRVEQKLYRSRDRAMKEVIRVVDSNKHYSGAPAIRGVHVDEAEVVVDGWMLITQEVVDRLTSRECDCCGESFTPKRSNQRYVDNAHRQRAYRLRSSLVPVQG